MRALWINVMALAFAAVSEAAEPGYVIVVHPDNPATAIDRKFLADAFLKKTTRWPNGDTIKPADQEPGAAPRRVFSDEVLRRSVAAVKSYWQQKIFSGRDVPPPELDSDAHVVRWVLKNRGAIGYVASGAEVHGAKIVNVK